MMKKILTGIILGCIILAACGIAMADDAKYVASKNSDKYHLAICATAQKIDAANRITFNTPEEAVKAGLNPCKVCNPPVQSAGFVASKGSDKYHAPTCRMAGKITPENKVTFANADEAKKAGYSPCQICCK